MAECMHLNAQPIGLTDSGTEYLCIGCGDRWHEDGVFETPIPGSVLVYSSDDTGPEGNQGRCPEDDCPGWLVWEDVKYPVDVECNVCGYSEQVHCCDDCAYGWLGEPLVYD